MNTLNPTLSNFSLNLVWPLKAVVLNIRNALKKYETVRHTRNELNSLTDRDLADIGISRWDIEQIAWEKANEVK